MTVAQMIANLDKVNVAQEAKESIEETKQTMLDLNAIQLEQGIKADGDNIHWLRDSHYPYTLPYARRKSAEGYQTSVVDLNKSPGKDFYKSLEIKQDGDQLQFDSTITLGQYLEKNYGKQILGLTNESKKTYTLGDFFQSFKKRIQEITGLHFR